VGGELEGDLLSGELAVDASEDVSLGLGRRLILGIEEDLEVTGSILDTGALPDNLRGVAQILQPVLMDGGEGAGAGTLMLNGTGVLALGLAHDAAMGNHDDRAIGTSQLLAQLVDEAGMDLLPGLELGNGDDEDKGTAAALSKVNLAGSVKLQGTEVSGDLGAGGGLEFKQGLAHGQFEFGGGGALVLDDELGLGAFHDVQV